MAKKRNLVFVTVDCLRADHVGFHGYGVPTTPFLDSLAGQSVIYERAIVAGLPTYYSFPAIFAARSPFRYGRDVLGLVSEDETLATALRSEGWRTAAFTAGNPYLTGRFGYDRGFDRFFGVDRPEMDLHHSALSLFLGYGFRLQSEERRKRPLY